MANHTWLSSTNTHKAAVISCKESNRQIDQQNKNFPSIQIISVYLLVFFALFTKWILFHEVFFFFEELSSKPLSFGSTHRAIKTIIIDRKAAMARASNIFGNVHWWLSKKIGYMNEIIHILFPKTKTYSISKMLHKCAQLEVLKFLFISAWVNAQNGTNLKWVAANNVRREKQWEMPQFIFEYSFRWIYTAE